MGFLSVEPHPGRYIYCILSCIHGRRPIDSTGPNKLVCHMTYDDGVCHIAREIILVQPDKLKDLVLCTGTFHMMKIIFSCLGKYLKGSETQKIWTESSIF